MGDPTSEQNPNLHTSTTAPLVWFDIYVSTLEVCHVISSSEARLSNSWHLLLSTTCQLLTNMASASYTWQQHYISLHKVINLLRQSFCSLGRYVFTAGTFTGHDQYLPCASIHDLTPVSKHVLWLIWCQFLFSSSPTFIWSRWRASWVQSQFF